MSWLLTLIFGPPETPIAPRAGLVGGLIALVAAAMSFLAVASLDNQGSPV